MAQMPLGQGVHAVLTVGTGIERVGQKHGVVEGRHCNAVPGEQKAIVLEVLPDLEDGRVLQQGLQHRQRIADRDLLQVLSGEVEGVAGGPMAERDIAGPARRHGHGEADELGAHGVEAGGLGIEGDVACGVGLADPGLEARQVGDRLVLRAVDPGGFRRGSGGYHRGLRRCGGRRGQFACLLGG